MIRTQTHATTWTLGLALALLVLSPAGAEVILDCQSGPMIRLQENATPVLPLPGPPFGLETKIDRPSTSLLLPLFAVDTEDVNGRTTLFAIRNVTDQELGLSTSFFDPKGAPLPAPPVPSLQPKDTYTVNVRGATVHEGGEDGISRGFVLIGAGLTDAATGEASTQPGGDSSKGLIGPAPGPPTRLITGDYFQVTSSEDFATGDRLLNVDATDFFFYDLCASVETRFLNGGAFTGGSDITVVAIQVGGVGPEDPATMQATIYDEGGSVTDKCMIFTDQFTLQLPISDLTATPFGTVELEFLGTLGQVITDFNASGRFSVGLRGACTDGEL